ncbi:TPA: hypothetical protein G8N62_004010 [Salmonella enterica]|uniref:Uncharacterized protein n=1 Tax=Salmonella enterica TaxID=28901 RepID=A0A749LNC3_SALER|nr:hypothetical protein [Salmonella enterica subsp. enterica serovar Braenderup]EDV1533257.1 hypothetical protein [Salmonella enterica subsp. enterica]EDW6338772.1 hypothetical protein [Salmonella enterica subsp. enterica serovar Hadar]EHA9142133.1 hypothetical protein [Salmonella enterica subsp. enterica serovar Bochum]HAF2594842.1 hypothetical protein [Salmonella enterica]
MLLMLHWLPDVVFSAFFVTRHAGAKKSASLLPSPWYTSENMAIAEKSDYMKTGLR